MNTVGKYHITYHTLIQQYNTIYYQHDRDVSYLRCSTTRYNIVYDDRDGGSIEVTRYLRTSRYVNQQVELVLYDLNLIYAYQVTRSVNIIL